MRKSIYITCKDLNGEDKTRTCQQWAGYMESLDMAKGNSPSAILQRYKKRKEFGYTLRQVVGIDLFTRRKPGGDNHKAPQTPMAKFLSTRLVSMQPYC